MKPVLTGEGSDELFLGYPFLCYQKYFDLLRAPARLTQSVTAATRRLRERLYPELHKNLAQFISDLNEGYSHAENRSRASEAFGFLGRRNRVKQCLTLEMATGYPLVGLLHRNDRMGMMASIESRFPFLDDELMRFAINLPHRWKLRRTWRVHDRKHPFLVDKFVVRQLAERTLPATLAKRRKWDFKMAAHSHLAVRSEFFHGGYLQQILRLTHRDLAQVVEREHPVFVARAVSVDLFGRLFALRERSEGHC